MTLRIAWASPWNERSAITTFGIQVVGALVEAGHQVDILRTEVDEFLQIPSPATSWTVRPMAEDTPDRIRADYDVVIANMGDHFGYHGALVSFRDLDPVIIFHDCYLANFCSGWAHLYPDAGRVLRTLVHVAYGAQSMPDGASFWLPPAEMMQLRPMIDLFVPNAAGAVVHAEHYLERVRRRCPGPVRRIPLSYPDLAVPQARDGDRLVVVTFGNVNSNKQAAEVIAAIGSSPELAAGCDYLLVGSIEQPERDRLEALARAHGVSSVKCTGWVDDRRLRQLLAGADVISCLRFPILEGGSASVIMAMLAGRPVLVSDHGCYGEIPDDVVLKCRPGAEAGDVARHLTALLADRTARHVLGARARAYAAEVHSPARYAQELLGPGATDPGGSAGHPDRTSLRSAVGGARPGKRRPGDPADRRRAGRAAGRSYPSGSGSTSSQPGLGPNRTSGTGPMRSPASSRFPSVRSVIPVYRPDLSGNERRYVLDCIDSSWISSLGVYIERFEKALAATTGAAHAVAVCNGTVALHLALHCLGIGPGDEVIVPSFTYIASVNTIAQTGATPVFADCRAVRLDARPRRRRAAGSRRAPGRSCRCICMAARSTCRRSPALAQPPGLAVVEDCAEALGTTIDGRHVGMFGDVGTFSFFGNKTVTDRRGRHGDLQRRRRWRSGCAW